MPSTQSTASEKHTVTENVRRELSKIAPGATVWIRTDKQNLWDKKVSLSQNKICKSRNGGNDENAGNQGGNDGNGGNLSEITENLGGHAGNIIEIESLQNSILFFCWN